MIFSDLYSEVASDFTNWVQAEGSSSTPDLALRYLNRAQNVLWSNPVNGWDYLIVDRVPLVLGGDTGLEVTLPTECKKIIAVYIDNNGDYRPDIYYYKDGRLVFGFQFTANFDKATGQAHKIKFYYAPAGQPYVKYQKTLADFVGGETPEYSFFPGELLLLCAQSIRTREKGLVQEQQLIDLEYRKLLKEFKAQAQHNCEDYGIEINDANGMPINIPDFRMGSGTMTRQVYGIRNDMDYRP